MRRALHTAALLTNILTPWCWSHPTTRGSMRALEFCKQRDGVMAVLFLSHASKDDLQASALEAWLVSNGFTDIFVDHHSIGAGDKWREALRASAGSCRVVLCLVTESWLASNECFNEFRAAWYMGKRIITLFLLPPAPQRSDEAGKRFAELCAEYQGIDLAAASA
jgi:hypothetical protein